MSWNKVDCVKSADQNVRKYVFYGKDVVAESVLYKYPMYEDRTVICCSTQSGCPVGCRFCGAGDYFVRSLTTDEIISQVNYLLADEDINHHKVKNFQIMFMSMGEPLLNWKELKGAIIALNLSYPRAKLLISTSCPKIKDETWKDILNVSSNIPVVGLQFSIHESTDDARNRLIPFKAKEPLKRIAVLGSNWKAATGRKPFFNYCAHEHNVSDEDALNIYHLYDPNVWEATISVVCERDESIAAANERQRELAVLFMNKLGSYGFSTRMFDPAGQDDIGGGCGQLWFVQEWMQQHPDMACPSIGEGLEILHAPLDPLVSILK